MTQSILLAVSLRRDDGSSRRMHSPALPLRLPAECKADTGDKAGLFVNTPKGPEGGVGSGGEGRDVGDKMQDHLFFFPPFPIPLSLLFTLLMEADLYQAPPQP